MCTTINTDYVLASLLASGKERITVDELLSFRQKIHRRLGARNVFCDITRRSLCNAVESNSFLFRWHRPGSSNETVVPAENSGRYTNRTYAEKAFGGGLPADVRKAVQFVAYGRG